MSSENKMGDLICIVDDDPDVRDSLETLLRSSGHLVRAFDGPQAFLECDVADDASCLILDLNLDGVNGLDFQEELRESDTPVPVILVSGFGDVPSTVRGMKAGAVTFLTKPFEEEALLAAVEEAIARGRSRRIEIAARATLQDRYDCLTPRERDMFGLVTAGLMNKQIAGRLDISEITVKIHRGNMVRKMEADSVPDLVRMAETLGIREPVTRYNRGR